MGMFDDFAFQSPHPKAVCARGHSVKGFQTKDFECLLDKYLVKEDQLYVIRFGAADDSPEPKSEEEVLEPVHCTATANIYTDCFQCPAIYTRQDWSTESGVWIAEHRPWCEFQVSFKKGFLVDVVPVEQETVDQVRQKCLDNAALQRLQDKNYKVVETDHPEVQTYLTNGRNNLTYLLKKKKKKEP
jgi:hypothetical protein